VGDDRDGGVNFSREIMEKFWETYGKIMPNHGRIMGNLLENHGKSMEESWEVLKFMTLRNGKISCVAYMDLSKNTVPCKHWSNQVFPTENCPLGGRMADVD
jgi:hypothetical protein